LDLILHLWRLRECVPPKCSIHITCQIFVPLSLPETNSEWNHKAAVITLRTNASVISKLFLKPLSNMLILTSDLWKREYHSPERKGGYTGYQQKSRIHVLQRTWRMTEYCLLSEEGNRVQKNPQQILVFYMLGGPWWRGVCGYLVYTTGD
jgi:hypothetical protein